MIIRQPFEEFLKKMMYEKITENRVKVALPVNPLIVNSIGVTHDDKDNFIAKAKAVRSNH